MRIDCLMENTTCREGIAAEHGLSLFIRTDAHAILFDMGQTDAFADNALRMGVPLEEADVAILSHGHYDHGGGLRRFLALNDRADVYLSRYAFEGHFHGAERNIGLDDGLRGHPRLKPVGEELVLDDQLSLHACNLLPRLEPIDSAGLEMLQDQRLLPEDFRHEQYLLIREGGRRVLISGCSHKGILDIVNWFRPDALVGGFHLMGLDPQRPQDAARLEGIAQALRRSGARFWTGHCTGSAAYTFLRERLGEQLNYLAAGESATV